MNIKDLILLTSATILLSICYAVAGLAILAFMIGRFIAAAVLKNMAAVHTEVKRGLVTGVR